MTASATRDAPDAADRILAATLRDGGGTFYADGEPWQDAHRASMALARAGDRAPHAYAVAVRPFAVAVTPHDVASIRAGLAGLRHGEYLGTWIDGGLLYVDAVRVLYSRAHAVTLGLRLRQLAIYDLTAGQDVRL